MRSVVLVLTLLAILDLGCAGDVPPDTLSDSGRVEHLTAGESRGEWDVEPFAQLGVLLDTPATRIEARVDGGEWRPIEITWVEGVHKVGRLVLEDDGTRLELRADQPWTFGTVQFFDDVVASGVLARDLPLAPALRTHVAALAPASMVISRAQWGARDPNRACGSWHSPNRISIHHTDLPRGDGGDAAARLRQIQAYHIDTRGWCDIGYHFVVSQSGKIYQGRSDEQRTGAHVDELNTGNIGIAFIGNFDLQRIQTAQFEAGARILGWVARTYDIPFSRRRILGHREQPGQSTDCPGVNLVGRLDELIALAQRSATTQPTEPAEALSGAPVSFEVNWRSDEADFYQADGSRGVADVFTGDWMRAEIKFENTTSVPLRGIQLAYEIEHLVPASYVIESDAPSFNGISFRPNDADHNPDNPFRLGGSGVLGIYAMAPGETKRVTIDFNAGDYSIGAVEHASLRAWVRHIDNYYGEQTGYDLQPRVNVFTSVLRSSTAADVLSRNEWQFEGGAANQLEGWRSCAGTTAVVDYVAGALVVSGPAGQCVESPEWTSIDTADWDQLVLRMNPVGDHKAAVYWARDGELFTADRAVTFNATERRSTYVLEVGSHPKWSGEITRLRIVPSTRQAATASIDALYFQSSDGHVATPREGYLRGDRVDMSTAAPAPGDGRLLDGRADTLGVPDRSSTPSRAGGCSTQSGAPSPLLALLGVLFGLRRTSGRRPGKHSSHTEARRAPVPFRP